MELVAKLLTFCILAVLDVRVDWILFALVTKEEMEASRSGRFGQSHSGRSRARSRWRKEQYGNPPTRV
jgi:hypothetical protein